MTTTKYGIDAITAPLEARIAELEAINACLTTELEALLTEAEDIFVCMADATGIDRHQLPPQFKSAGAAIKFMKDAN